MSRIRLTHNGTEVKFYDDIGQADDYIAKALLQYQELNPELLFYDSHEEIELDPSLEWVSVYVYRYKTLYHEIFVLEAIKDGH